MSAPLVKICGMTSRRDVVAACRAGASLLGFNFYSRSPRYVTPERATELLHAVPSGVSTVGVFVNQRVSEVEAIQRKLSLDLVQFHGDEDQTETAALASLGIRALRVSPDQDLAEQTALWATMWGLLFDTPSAAGEGVYGGSGESWDYGGLAAIVGRGIVGRGMVGRGMVGSSMVGSGGLPRILLAGGLHPGNVAAAVAALPGLYAVDVCSGVESSPGVKEEHAMREFVREVERGAGIKGTSSSNAFLSSISSGEPT